jgi:hypothetical protein
MSEDDITKALSGIDTRLALLEGMMQLIGHRGQHGPDHAPQGQHSHGFSHIDLGDRAVLALECPRIVSTDLDV